MQITDKISSKMVLVLFHLLLGFAFTYPMVSKLFVQLMFGIALVHVYTSRNNKNEALFWSIYFVSGEVLYRMTNGLIFHESVKYMVILLLFMGIIFEKEKRVVNITFILYLLLLSIGIAVADFPEGASYRKNIAFNLSGPVVLAVSAIYMYLRKISYNQLAFMFVVAFLPMLTMLSYLYLKTPDLSEITFNTESNKATSGGYGPNQVATLLGFGMFALASLIILRKRLTDFLFLDILILIYITYRGLLTFSRGGMITAFIALLALSIFYFLSQKKMLYTSLKYFSLAFIMGIGIWVYTSGVTNGMLDNRYANKSARGVKQEDVTSGREDISKQELNNFYENPIFGIGVGGSKFKRLKNTGVDGIASHSEVTRILSEHGLIGLFSLLLLLVVPLLIFLKVDYFNKGFLLAFYIFWFLTINHSAMRIAFPGFVYGLSLLILIPDKEEDEATD